jgi:hypothetical protein
MPASAEDEKKKKFNKFKIKCTILKNSYNKMNIHILRFIECDELGANNDGIK